jgi:hypothetical protein
MDLEGWPDKMLRPEGEEITMTDAEEEEVDNARAADELADAEEAQESMEVGPSTMKYAIVLVNEAERSGTISSVVAERANQLAAAAVAMQVDADEAKQVAEKALAAAEDAVAGTKKLIGMAAAAVARAKTDTDGASLSTVEPMSPCMAGLGLDHVESLDVAADAAHERARVLLSRGAAWSHLLETLTLTRDVTYSVFFVVAFVAIAPFVLVWRAARWLNGE